MDEREPVNNDSPELEDAIRSIEAIGEGGAVAEEPDEADAPNDAD